jgi:hypothetical protein
LIGCRPGTQAVVEVLDVEMRTKGWLTAVETWNKKRSPKEERGSAPLPRLAMGTKESKRVPMKEAPRARPGSAAGASPAPATWV